MNGPKVPPHLYVHVPLCRAKCAYCDFYSVPSDPQVHEPFVERVLAEAEELRERLPEGTIETLYVGGGTPTMLGYRLPQLVGRLLELFDAPYSAEVTVEANPDSVDRRLVEWLADAGVTRVSLGVQSFDDRVLGTLGRVHDAHRAERAALSIIAAGLDLSEDLMCAIPGQSNAAWEESLHRALATGAEHVSVYPLTVEDGTPMADAVASGELPEPDPDIAAAMMLRAEEVLSAAGLRRYEVASHARPGKESRHNTAYWTGREYVGLGPGAHSMFSADTAAELPGHADELGEERGRVRFARSRDLLGYATGDPSLATDRVECETLTAEEAAREDAMLGLRLARGIDDELVGRAGVLEAVRSLRDDGLLERVDGRWRTTPRGWLLGDVVFGRVWNLPDGERPAGAGLAD